MRYTIKEQKDAVAKIDMRYHYCRGIEMKTRQRQKFIRQLVGDVLKDLLEESKQYPEDWDGIELRERIKDFFSQVVIEGTCGKNRKKEYNNYVLVNNLR